MTKLYLCVWSLHAPAAFTLSSHGCLLSFGHIDLLDSLGNNFPFRLYYSLGYAG